MHRPNLAAFILLVINLLSVHLIGVINSSLSVWGCLLYLPALFFFSATILLDRSRVIGILTLTGFSLDSVYNTPGGFHSFALIFCFLVAKDWLHSGKSGELVRPYYLQIIANILISLGLICVLNFRGDSMGDWAWPNIVVDIFISTFIFAAISPWFTGLCRELLQVTFSSEKRESANI